MVVLYVYMLALTSFPRSTQQAFFSTFPAVSSYKSLPLVLNTKRNPGLVWNVFILEEHLRGYSMLGLPFSIFIVWVYGDPMGIYLHLHNSINLQCGYLVNPKYYKYIYTLYIRTIVNPKTNTKN